MVNKTLLYKIFNHIGTLFNILLLAKRLYYALFTQGVYNSGSLGKTQGKKKDSGKTQGIRDLLRELL